METCNPTDLKSLTVHLQREPYLWALSNGTKGRILTCVGLYDGQIHLKAPNGHIMKFTVDGGGTPVNYLSDRFTKVNGSIFCEYVYFSKDRLPMMEWEESLGDVERFHATP